MIKMYEIEDRIIHGSSFAVALDTIEFLTWRLNEDTGDYWVKFHLPSSKEIRIKVVEADLRNIVDEWGKADIDLILGGDRYV